MVSRFQKSSDGSTRCIRCQLHPDMCTCTNDHTLRQIGLLSPQQKASTETMHTRLMMQYIGVCTLLGRIAKHLPAGDENHFGVDKAMRDANNLLLVEGSEVWFDKSSGGGYAAFERSQLKTRTG
jgi:hypothetical protein